MALVKYSEYSYHVFVSRNIFEQIYKLRNVRSIIILITSKIIIAIVFKD